MNELPPLATPEQTSEFLQVPVRTLKAWRYQGTGPEFIKVGKHVRYRRAVIEKYLKDHTQKTGDAR